MKTRSNLFLLLQFIIAGLAIFLFAQSSFNRFIWDLRFKINGPQKPSGEIVIVAIDEASLALGRWPWRRDLLALLTERVFQLGAKNVGFDILFPEKNLENQKSDALFAKVLEKHSSKVTLAWFKNEYGEIKKNIALFSNNIQSQGFVNTDRDTDGIFRRVQYVIWNEKKEPSLALSLIAQRLGVNPWSLVSVDDSSIRHMGSSGTFRTLSAIELLKSQTQDPFFSLKDKTVLIGVTALGAGDVQPTPLGKEVPGVEIQATIAEQILTNRIPKNVDLIFRVFGLFILFGLVIYTKKKNVLISLLIGTMALTVFALVDFFFLFPRDVYLNSGGFYIALGWVVLFSVGEKFFLESEQKRFIRNAFSRYLAPEVVKQLLVDPQSLKLGGEKKEITILFCDLRNFTSVSEKLEPTILTQLLNESFTLLTEIIFEHQGTVDKYIGDAVMAFFGAPIEQPDHAHRACDAANEMKIRFQEKQTEFKAKYGVELVLGIGINSGICLVGNIGSEQRFSYSVLGDAVNVASRVESCNKDYGTQILVTEEVLKSIEVSQLAFPHTKFIDKTILKGRSTPTTLFELK